MNHLQSYNLFEGVDFKKLDLKGDFQMLNDLMFDGKLKPVPLRIMNTKNVVGLMSYEEFFIGNDRAGSKVKDIGISNYYEMERNQYLAVLAHEMIHLWMEQNGLREKDHHGPIFMKKLKELNDKFPEYDIKKSEDAALFKVSGNKIKEYGVVLIDESAGEKVPEHLGVYSVIVVQPSVVENEQAINDFIEGMKKYALHKFRALTIGIYKSKYPDLSKWKVKKSLSLTSLELYSLTPEQAKAIMEDGTEIMKIKLK